MTICEVSDMIAGGTMRNIFSLLVVSVLMLFGIASYAGKPALNVSGNMHPNLTGAQRLSRQAYDKIIAAQLANEYDLKGHAKRAKGLIEVVNEELMLAAEAANVKK